MGTKEAENSRSRLEVGRRVIVSSLEKTGREIPSKITKVSSQMFQLEATRSTTVLAFQEGEQIRVQYSEDGVLYCWDGKVDKISGRESRTASFSLTGVGLTIHKRKSPRVQASIPFLFMVFDAAETDLIGDQLVEATTRDIGVGGMSFKTDLPSKVGDQLQLTLQIPINPVNVSGWVVRCEPDEAEYWVAVEFLHPDEKEQTQLMQFLAESSGELAS